MKPYCHMGKMCLGCSPQLLQGICPDSKAGMIVAELVGALMKAATALERVEHLIGGGDDEVSIESEILTARDAIAKATGGEG